MSEESKEVKNEEPRENETLKSELERIIEKAKCRIDEVLLTTSNEETSKTGGLRFILLQQFQKQEGEYLNKIGLFQGETFPTKEKDVVQFNEEWENDDGEEVDNEGDVVGCHICHTHEKADKKLSKLFDIPQFVPAPVCPRCGKLLHRRYMFTDDSGNAIVGESNGVNPEAYIGYYSIWKCETEGCTDSNGNINLYALMPVPIEWNANHDIYYTGGDRYLIEKEHEELAAMIFEGIKPDIEQFIQRKLNPKNPFDSQLNMDSVMLWVKRSVSGSIAKWMYENGWKK